MTQNFSNTRIIRLPEVKSLTGLGRSNIYSRMKDGTFPKHIHLGERSVGWVESEVRAWIGEQISANRPAA